MMCYLFFVVTRRSQGWPFIGSIVAWIIALVVNIGGILIVFAMGISMGNDIVHQWVTSIIVSIFVNLIFTQSLPVSVFAQCLRSTHLAPIF